MGTCPAENWTVWLQRMELRSSNSPPPLLPFPRIISSFFRFHKAASVIVSCSHKSWLSTFCSHNSRLSIAHRGFGSVIISPKPVFHIQLCLGGSRTARGQSQMLCTVSEASIRTTVTTQSCSTGPKHRYNTKIWDLLQDVTFFLSGSRACRWS